VVELAPGGARRVVAGEHEVLVLALSGSATVEVDGDAFELAGRRNVFAGISDFVYAPPGSELTISSDDGGRFAVPGARASAGRPARHTAAADVAVELRGAGHCSRQVVNLCLPATFDAERLIACEVYTPAGNWSSFPPHKHDEESERETELEEIYYFEVGSGPAGPGVAYQRVYGTAERPIDVLAEVGSGDVVLVPHGWHGPSIATPGYDLYYLNVMAGPGAERAWRVCFDATHAWVMDNWPDQAVDPRLPLVSARPGTAP
jgi:5-deoxy-glucuronate isomerase